jgi:hypothetical protein
MEFNDAKSLRDDRAVWYPPGDADSSRINHLERLITLRRYCSFLLCRTSFLLRLFIQQREKAVEDDACVLQKFSIVAEILAQTVYDRV